jgi:phage tail-like protein
MSDVLAPNSPAVTERSLVGLNLFRAKLRIDTAGLIVGKIKYVELPHQKNQVVRAVFRSEEEKQFVDLLVGTDNMIRFLPSMFQKEDFLRNFLMIFQHIHNEIGLVLENQHNYFTPVEAPHNFLKWLSSWFGMKLSALLPVEKMRLLLQNAMTLYRWRGTIKGIKRLMQLVTDVEPEIFENRLPSSEFVFQDDHTHDNMILESKEFFRAYFTVHFPFYRSDFSPQVLHATNALLQSEKPANTLCVVSFNKEKEDQKSKPVISESTIITDQEGLTGTKKDDENE